MAGPYDAYWSVQADIAKFLDSPTAIQYHRGADPAVLHGEDGNPYIIFPVGDNSSPYIGKITDQTFHQYTNTDFQAALASATNLTAVLSGLSVTPASFVPAPGSKYFLWIGLVSNGNQLVALRFKIDNTGTAVFDYGSGTGSSLWQWSPFHQGLNVGHGPFGSAKIGNNLYTVLMLNQGIPGVTYAYNPVCLVKFPLIAGGGVNNTADSWDTVHVEIPQHMIGADPYPYEVSFGPSGTGQRQGRVAIWDVNGDGSTIGCLNYEYYSDTGGNPKLRYYQVSSSLVVSATVDKTSQVSSILADAGLNYAGAVGTTWDDWGTPTIFDGNTFVWSRTFSDNPHVIRSWQMDKNFNILSGPVEFTGIVQTMDIAVTNQQQIAAYKTDNTELVLVYDTGHFLYLATFGPPAAPPAPSARRGSVRWF